MRLRCAACGCYVRATTTWPVDNVAYGGDWRVQPCKRCLAKRFDKAYKIGFKHGWMH